MRVSFLAFAQKLNNVLSYGDKEEDIRSKSHGVICIETVYFSKLH